MSCKAVVIRYGGGAFETELVNNLIGFADKELYESKKQPDTYTINMI